jgi:hypothetical protein
MFRSTHNKGFQMKFTNELTISVQFGLGNYCESKTLQKSFEKDSSEIEKAFPEMGVPLVESSSAEIAIWDDKGTWFNFGYEDVKGWVSPNEVAMWIYITSTAEDIKHLKQIAIDSKLIEALKQ